MKATKAMLVASSLFVLLPLVGRAGLVSTVNTDTITDLDIDWSWDPETPGSDTPTLLNWSVFLDAKTDNTNWDLRLMVQHKANPHAGETSPAAVIQSYSFPAATGYGVVINDSFNVVHPSAGHLDNYMFVLDRNAIPSSTSVSLTAVHQVPEPSTALLVGISGGFFYFIRRLRL